MLCLLIFGKIKIFIFIILAAISHEILSKSRTCPLKNVWLGDKNLCFTTQYFLLNYFYTCTLYMFRMCWCSMKIILLYYKIVFLCCLVESHEMDWLQICTLCHYSSTSLSILFSILKKTTSNKNKFIRLNFNRRIMSAHENKYIRLCMWLSIRCS